MRAGLAAAATAGDVDAVRRLIDLGFAVDSVDAQGCTALLRAAGGGHLAVVDLLLARIDALDRGERLVNPDGLAPVVPEDADRGPGAPAPDETPSTWLELAPFADDVERAGAGV